MSAQRDSRRLCIGALLLLGLSLVYFGARGPARAVVRCLDLPMYYSSTAAWLAGANPYDMERLQALYAKAGGDDQKVSLSNCLPTMYPVLAVLAALPYQHAKLIMAAVNVALVISILWILLRLTGFSPTAPRGLLFLACGLALAPVHTCISQGQFSLAVTALILAALVAERAGREAWMGVAIALAGALKPQMAVAFGVYYLLARRWRAVLAGAAVTAVLAAISLGRMQAAGVEWLPAFRANILELLVGGSGDASSTLPIRYMMQGLELVLYQFLRSDAIVKSIVLGFALCMLLFLLRLRRRPADPLQTLAVYSLLGLVSLLSVYNLFYCASLLLLPLAWALWALPEHPRWPALASLFALCPFLVPGAALLLTLQGRGRLPAGLVESRLWSAVILPHQVYCLLGLAALIAVWLGIRRPTPAGRPPA